MKTKKAVSASKPKTKAGYVDGFLLIVPAKNINAYKKMAKLGGKVWTEHGALDYRECTGDDLVTKMGKSFPALTGSKKDELIVFSWISYKSRAHRDSVNAKVMKDPRLMKLGMKEMPFDMKRMSFGGFKVLVKY